MKGETLPERTAAACRLETAVFGERGLLADELVCAGVRRGAERSRVAVDVGGGEVRRVSPVDGAAPLTRWKSKIDGFRSRAGRRSHGGRRAIPVPVVVVDRRPGGCPSIRGAMFESTLTFDTERQAQVERLVGRVVSNRDVLQIRRRGSCRSGGWRSCRRRRSRKSKKLFSIVMLVGVGVDRPTSFSMKMSNTQQFLNRAVSDRQAVCAPDLEAFHVRVRSGRERPVVEVDVVERDVRWDGGRREPFVPTAGYASSPGPISPPMIEMSLGASVPSDRMYASPCAAMLRNVTILGVLVHRPDERHVSNLQVLRVDDEVP